MPEFSIPYDSARGHFMTRAAESFLRALGGGSVLLRLPVGAPAGSSDLGLASPLIEDVALEPAVVRALPPGQDAGQARIEVLLSAAAVEAQVERSGYPSAEELFAAALGLVLAGKLWRVASVTSDTFAGAAYLYRVTATP
ncbi:MAG TPA: hypothetical protein VE825_17765 [Terriglobales bacterium]|jgi:hypothetical protein|nr:hypothetical protein [Terriglobales bacterium]